MHVLRLFVTLLWSLFRLTQTMGGLRCQQTIGIGPLISGPLNISPIYFFILTIPPTQTLLIPLLGTPPLVSPPPTSYTTKLDPKIVCSLTY